MLLINGGVSVPVSVDLEGGYGRSVEGAARAALATIEPGAVGLNLEDGTGDANQPLCELNLQTERIAAMRGAAPSSEVPLVINALTDVLMIPA